MFGILFCILFFEIFYDSVSIFYGSVKTLSSFQNEQFSRYLSVLHQKRIMKTRNFTLSLPFTLSLTLISQITISGKVLGRNNKPLKDVSVTLKDTYDGTLNRRNKLQI